MGGLIHGSVWMAQAFQKGLKCSSSDHCPIVLEKKGVRWGGYVVKEKFKRLNEDLKVWNKNVFGSLEKNIEEHKKEIWKLDTLDEILGLECCGTTYLWTCDELVEMVSSIKALFADEQVAVKKCNYVRGEVQEFAT
ncbi:hypothetical protein ACS0TY_027113 [Phlomoides rotata]